MTGLGPDLQNCFDYVRATKNVDELNNSCNISKMVANPSCRCVIRMSQRPYLWIYLTELAQINKLKFISPILPPKIFISKKIQHPPVF